MYIRQREIYRITRAEKEENGWKKGKQRQREIDREFTGMKIKPIILKALENDIHRWPPLQWHIPPYVIPTMDKQIEESSLGKMCSPIMEWLLLQIHNFFCIKSSIFLSIQFSWSDKSLCKPNWINCTYKFKQQQKNQQFIIWMLPTIEQKFEGDPSKRQTHKQIII